MRLKETAFEPAPEVDEVPQWEDIYDDLFVITGTALLALVRLMYPMLKRDVAKAQRRIERRKGHR